MQIELGLDTFGDTCLGPDGRLKPHDAVLRDVVEQGVLADDLGIHCRPHQPHPTWVSRHGPVVG